MVKTWGNSSDRYSSPFYGPRRIWVHPLNHGFWGCLIWTKGLPILGDGFKTSTFIWMTMLYHLVSMHVWVEESTPSVKIYGFQMFLEGYLYSWVWLFWVHFLFSSHNTSRTVLQLNKIWIFPRKLEIRGTIPLPRLGFVSNFLYLATIYKFTIIHFSAEYLKLLNPKVCR